MKKSKKLLSLLVALAISASAVSGLAITASAAPDGESDNRIVLFDEPSAATEAPSAATEAPSAATDAPTVSGKDNDITIDENFDNSTAYVPGVAEVKDSEGNVTATPVPEIKAETYTGDAEDYKWNVLTTTVMGSVSGGGGTKLLSNPGVSLSANAGQTILTIADGAGGQSKDIDVKMDAGMSDSFSQAAATWDMIFKSTDGTQLFIIRFTNGGNWACNTALVADGEEVKVANYSFTKSTFTNISAHISFVADGGKVTFGNVSANFSAGKNLGSISIVQAGASDQSRPFVIDNFKMSTTAKEKVTLTLTSDDTEGEVEGAEVKIGEDTYTADANGKVEAYYLPGTYNYEIKLAKHKSKTGSLKVVTEGATETKYTFSNIPSDVTEPVLIHAYYKADKALDSVTTEKITPANGAYSVVAAPKNNCAEEYYLWDSLEGMKPVAAAVKSETALTNDFDIELEYVGDPKPVKIVIGGGDEYIYSPGEGGADSKSKAFTATVYDQSDLVMEDQTVEWSLPAYPGSDAITIEDGVVTLTSDFLPADDNGVDVVIRATVAGTNPAVTADTSIHVNYPARPNSWDIEGPLAVKDGTQATYKVANLKDQYGNEYTGEAPSFTLTSDDATAVIDGLKITPKTGTGRTKDIVISMALADNANVKVDKTITAYGYDFYEPGFDALSTEATGTRFEDIDGATKLVWPKANGTTVITLPTAVGLANGSAKMITFDNTFAVQLAGYQKRELIFKNTSGTTVLAVDFAAPDVLIDYSQANSKAAVTGTSIGKMGNMGEVTSAVFILKTDMTGITTATLSYNGQKATEKVLNPAVDGTVTPLTDIASITLTVVGDVPDDRQISLTNLVISDSDIAEVEISGDDTIAKISGLTATKTFRGSVFSQSDDETFTWSVAGEDGNAVAGVSIDQKGVLSVADSVAADTKVVISYTSSVSTAQSPKLATHEVTIKDFATIESAELNGPVAVNAGESVTYKVENVVDQYGDKVTMPVVFEITDGKDTIAAIDASTGVVTTTGTIGSYTVKATIGNPGKTIEKTIKAAVAKYAEAGTTDQTSVVVDVSKLANYAADTKYLVTTATADGTLVKQTDNVAHTDGKVTVDTTGAAKYEVSPIYTYNSVGNVASGKDIPICDGRYQFKFVKANMTRGDIYVNGLMVANNADQDGFGMTPASSSPMWTSDDVLVQGGKATVVMKDNTSDMKSIEVRKNPSIVTRKAHLYILGDSLVSDYRKTFDYSTGNIPPAGDAQTGWGQVLDKFISDDVNVTNLAESGNFARGLYSPAFTSALASAEAGDYILIECGYNDANSKNSSASEMKQYLERMADDCAEKNVVFIMCGPNFGPCRGDTNSSSAKFTSDVLEAANTKGVLGINLSAAGSAFYTAKGWTSDYWAKNFNCYNSKTDAVADSLHLSYHGAMLHASLVAQAISDAQKDTSNAELAASLAGLKLDKTAKTLTDSNGATLTFQVN